MFKPNNELTCFEPAQLFFQRVKSKQFELWFYSYDKTNGILCQYRLYFKVGASVYSQLY